MSILDRLPALRRSIEQSLQDLRPFREKRKEFLEQFVGFNYSESGAPDKVPVNFVELAVNIYRRLLVTANPQTSVLTPHRHLMPVASELELALNQLLQKIQFLESAEECVTEAMFSMGIMKIGISDTGVEGFNHAPGQYYADPVAIQDFVYDTNASRYEQVAYAGDRYLVPLDLALQHPMYDAEAKSHLQRFQREIAAGRDDLENAETLSKQGAVYDEGFRVQVEVWDLWLPSEGVIATMQLQGNSPPLWVRPWNGPAHGPYRLFRPERVPKNIQPLAPVALWFDLHDLSNMLWRKLSRQAERQKTQLLVGAHNEEDGKRIVEASDGEAVPVKDPTSSKEVRMGGADQINTSFALQIRNLFNLMSGNVEMLGGIAPTSETLGQDRLLNENASERIKSMQDQMVRFVTGCVEDLAWYLWHDDLIELPLIRRIPGTNYEVPILWNPESREGNFFDYNFTIAPYSLRTPSPQERLASINRILMEIAIPLQQLLSQQGISIDFEAYFRMAAKYLNNPELNELLIYAMSQHVDQPVGDSMAAPKPGGPRRYVRENVSHGPTREAQANQMAMTLASQMSELQGMGNG